MYGIRVPFDDAYLWMMHGKDVTNPTPLLYEQYEEAKMAAETMLLKNYKIEEYPYK